MTTTILIADDHAIMRDGLRFLLEAEEDLAVIGSAGDGDAVVELARQLHPDIILMDIEMPGQSGIDATLALRDCCPRTRVVVLSMHLTTEHVYRALSAGARGYLIKEAAGKQVIAAIRAVMAGERYLSKRVVDLITEAFLAGYQPVSTTNPLQVLSPREREIVHLVIAGQSSKEIAQTLSLSPKTIDTYRSRIMDKLGVHDLCALGRKAQELGIVPP